MQVIMTVLLMVIMQVELLELLLYYYHCVRDYEKKYQNGARVRVYEKLMLETNVNEYDYVVYLYC